ncbi:MAG: haloacid dehalogenase-like hydrolase [Candidatus Korobacteraceae bacterium]
MSATDCPSAALQFIESVLALRPAIAVFDCDGTLWSGDAGADFFYWEMERGIVSRQVAQWARARYKQYQAGKVNEEQICGEMVTMNRGVSCRLLRRAAREFFTEVVSPRVFPEMQELTRRLAAQGCTLWAVSSTNNWLVEHAARQFSIARQRVLAACVQVERGCASDRLVRVPTDELKVVAIRKHIGQSVDVALGNSIHDQAMLEMAKHPLCVNPNDDLEQIARERGWPVYWPAGTKHQPDPHS